MSTLITEQTLIKAGFRYPDPSLYREDARGNEYGKFIASVESDGYPIKSTIGSQTGLIRVTKLNDGGTRIYTLYFVTAESFNEWVEDVL
jgi:hypothetical protein